MILFSWDNQAIYNSTIISSNNLNNFITTIAQTFQSYRSSLSLLSNPIVNALEPKEGPDTPKVADVAEIYCQIEDFSASSIAEQTNTSQLVFELVTNFELFFLSGTELINNLDRAFRSPATESSGELAWLNELKKNGFWSDSDDAILKHSVQGNNFEFLRLMKMSTNILNEINLEDTPNNYNYTVKLARDHKSLSMIFLTLAKLCGEGRRFSEHLKTMINP